MKNLFEISRIIWCLTGIYWIIAAQFTKRSIKKEEIAFRTMYMILWTCPFAITFFSILPDGMMYLRCYPVNSTWEILTFILFLAGLSLMIWSRIELGRNWSGRIAVKESHQLITTGPYRIVRNPMYFGFIVAFFFNVLLLGEVRGFLAFIMLVTGIFIKLHKEEKIVAAIFKEQYAAYAMRVKKIIPFIY